MKWIIGESFYDDESESEEVSFEPLAYDVVALSQRCEALTGVKTNNHTEAVQALQKKGFIVRGLIT